MIFSRFPVPVHPNAMKQISFAEKSACVNTLLSRREINQVSSTCQIVPRQPLPNPLKTPKLQSPTHNPTLCLLYPSTSPPNTYSLRPRPIARIPLPKPPIQVNPIIPTLPRAVIVDVLPPNVVLIRETFFWDLERKCMASSFSGVVDSLELLEDAVAV